MMNFIEKKFHHASLFIGWLVIYLFVFFVIARVSNDPLRATVIGNLIVLALAGVYYWDRIKPSNRVAKLSVKEVLVYACFSVVIWIAIQSMVIFLIDIGVRPPADVEADLMPVFVVLAVIVAPILEEVLFRGVFYHHLREQWGVSIGLILSVLLFALLHLNVHQFSAAVLGGLFFTVVYEKTRRVSLCIGLHMLMNGLSIGLAGRQVPSWFGSVWLTMILIMIVVVGCLVILNYKRTVTQE